MDLTLYLLGTIEDDPVSQGWRPWVRCCGCVGEYCCVHGEADCDG
jgi:hypothetical protein